MKIYLKNIKNEFDLHCDSKMKFQFRKEITELYLNELKMNKSVIEPIIELYENAF
jgi:hypothetical protein